MDVGMNTKFYDAERREFIRVRAELPVKYKFLSHQPGLVPDEIFEGTTNNLSGGGLLLVGSIPNTDWITGLLMERIVVGVNVLLPSDPEPVKALTRTAWVEALDERAHRCSLGLKFKEITKVHLDKIFKFVIKAQMP
jgi:c-di-GMP-binding flagellar brake protein YcgR